MQPVPPPVPVCFMVSPFLVSTFGLHLARGVRAIWLRAFGKAGTNTGAVAVSAIRAWSRLPPTDLRTGLIVVA